MTSSQTIAFGVVSGLISGYAIFLLAALFKRVVLPWYRSVIYKGLNISGTWQLHSDDYQRRDITFQINQRADTLWLEANSQCYNQLDEEMRQRLVRLTKALGHSLAVQW